MGKLTGYIIGVVATLAFAYYFLSTYYDPLINWLSPYIGPQLPVVLGLLFLYMGDPLHWPILIAVWIILGIIVGISARKGSAAVGAGFLTYFTVLGIMGLAVASMFLNLGSGTGLGAISGGTSVFTAISSGTLSPPPGTNLYSILTEPVLGRFVQVVSLISGSLSLGGVTVNPSVVAAAGPTITSAYYSIAEKVLALFLPYIIANLAIFLITAGLVGRFLNRLIDPTVRSKKKNKSGKTGNNIAPVIAILALLVLSSAVPLLHASPQSASPATNVANSYQGIVNSGMFSVAVPGVGESHSTNVFQAGSAQNLSNLSGVNFAGGIVGKYGDVFNSFGFIQASNYTTFSGWVATAQKDNSLFTAVALSSNLSDIVDALQSDGLLGLSSISNTSSSSNGSQLFSHYLDLIPPLIIAEAYPGDYNSTSVMASSEATAIASSASATGLTRLISLTLPVGYIGNVSIQTTLYLYGAQTASSAGAKALLSSVSPAIDNTGSFPLFSNGINSGYLIPGATSTSVNGSFFLAGYVNSKEIETLLSTVIGLNSSIPVLANSILFTGGLFQKSGIFFSQPNSRVITAAEIFNSQSSITFQDPNVLSGLLLGYPVLNGSGNTSSEIYNYSSFTNVQNVSLSALGINSPLVYVGSSTPLNLANLNVTSNAIFPAKISVTITLHLLNSTAVQVNTTLQNLGTRALTGLSISEYGILSSYPGLISLTSGSTNITGQTVNQTAVFYSYTLNFKNPGMYVMPPPVISYTLDGNQFSYAYTDPVIVIPYPSVFSTVNNIKYNSAALISQLIGQNVLIQPIYPGLYVFDLIPIALVLIDIPLEYRWAKRIAKRRREWKASNP